MPELPEAFIFARDMHESLVGKRLANVKVLQPKCINIEVAGFQAALVGSMIQAASYHEKMDPARTLEGSRI